jgi:GTPase SAR1 family protein
VYDIASHTSFDALPTFLNDARALASPNLTVLLAGNKLDISTDSEPEEHLLDQPSIPPELSSSQASRLSVPNGNKSLSTPPSISYGLGAQLVATKADHGREVTTAEASRWASAYSIPVAVEVSALNGEGVDEVFARLARMILTKIELGEIDPDDPQSGIQYGDSAAWIDADGQSIKSGDTTFEENGLSRRHKKGRPQSGTGRWGGSRDWEDAFRLTARGRRRRGWCC